MQILAAFALAGCTVELPHVGNASDVWTQPPNDAIDLLFLVDDSASMDEAQHALAAAVPELVGQLDASEVDFHIGVAVPTADGLRVGGLAGEPPYLTRDDAQDLPDRLLVGTDGTGPELGLAAIDEALSPASESGFLRDDAPLAIVVVAAVDDCSIDLLIPDAPRGACPAPATPVEDYVAAWQNRLVDPSYLQVSAAVGQRGGCSETAEGTRYLQLAAYAQGEVADLCDPGWNGILAHVGERATSVRTTFPLTSAARVDTLIVDVDRNGSDDEPVHPTADDLPIAPDPANGWTYDPFSRALTLHGDAVPETGATIYAYYSVDAG
jgi:hypothetical protein